MTAQEAKHHTERMEKFRSLDKIRDELYAARKAITEGWADGPCGQNPFTGNWRESRQVELMTISFTRTRGGAAPVETTIKNLHIEACELGWELRRMIEKKIEALNDEMEKI